MVDINTSSLILNSWKSSQSQTTDKIVYISLAAAVDSKFDWEKLGKVRLNKWKQLLWTKKKV